MKILNAELVTSASTGGPGANLLRDDLPQFSFVGRSNVGKSSLLNALMRQKLARTSAAAGKTRLAHVYRVTVEDAPGGPGRWSTYLVDLPGYGYARGGDESVRELAGVVEGYFAAAAPRRGAIFLLVDSRHPGLPADVQANEWLSASVAPPIILATKVDKLSRSERAKNLQKLERVFGRPAIAVSVTKGDGIDALWRVISATARDDERP